LAQSGHIPALLVAGIFILAAFLPDWVLVDAPGFDHF
jgi:hypothetical protein